MWDQWFDFQNGDRTEVGKHTSSHKGDQKPSTAFDIKTLTSSDRSIILAAVVKAGFNRIGIAKNFIHVDDDESKPANVAWLY